MKLNHMMTTSRVTTCVMSKLQASGFRKITSHLYKKDINKKYHRFVTINDKIGGWPTKPSH